MTRFSAIPSLHVIGASGRSGAALARVAQQRGVAVVPVVRDAARWSATGLGGAPRLATLEDAPALHAALADATHIVCAAHARHTQAVLAAAPAEARIVLLGSTRKFTRWPDAHGNGVLAGEAALLASGRDGIMLHPTMIYGAQGEDNVQRLAALLARLPMLPLPGDGRALVQPIHQADVTRAILAALALPPGPPRSIVIAGPQALEYRDFIAAVAEAAALRLPHRVAVPAWLLMAAAAATRLLPGLPTIRAAEIRRLLEDKAFDITPMHDILGVAPMALPDGLALTFATI